MLQSLEIVGFKSFADKSRFEFGRGISVVVGPNGSGKSNVVDALKWVLGETSVKSLRGKEMTDVIFNGSTSRHPLNTAEASVFFDNRGGWLACDSPQVRLTRRVYRNGEGEYFINQQACRRRDIRDLLAGTGLGGGGYSIIEQGRVDAMLQASPRDRRLIFEEAAGISRFRLKKQETERRLERVDQNLLRLKDIVDEVETRLRSVRMQAGKARKHREYAARLQELRTQVGLVDWRKLSHRLQDLEQQIGDLRRQSDECAAQAETCQRQYAELEALLTELDQAQHARDAATVRVRQRITACEATIVHELARLRETEEELPQHARQLIALQLQAGDLHEQRRETAALLARAETKHEQLAGAEQEQDSIQSDLSRRLSELRAANESRRGEYLERMRASAALGNEIGALDARIAADMQGVERLRQRQAALDAAQADAQALREALDDERQRLERELAAQTEASRASQQELAEARQRLARIESEAASHRELRTAARERTAILADLERRQEGLSAGAREVLRLADESPHGPLRHVLGVVADVFQVNVDAAPLVEIALGEAVGWIIVEPAEDLHRELERLASRLQGRAGFVPLAPAGPSAERDDDPRAEDRSNSSPSGFALERREGVIGRADLFVETLPRFRPLARRLLADTWIVESLAHARSYQEEMRCAGGAPCNFVTLGGERLAADQTLTIGAALGATGLISRRSELRELHARVEELTSQLMELKTAQAAAASNIVALEQSLAHQAEALRHNQGELADVQRQIAAASEHLAQLARDAAGQSAEMAAVQARLAAAELERLATAERQSLLDGQLVAMERGIAAAAREVIALDHQRQELLSQLTEAKIERAKSDERLATLRLRSRQCEKDADERRLAVERQRAALRECRQRAAAIALRALRAESEAADLCWQHEALVAAARELERRRHQHRHERNQALQLAHRLADQLRRLDEQLHAQDMATSSIRLERRALADRLREDYGIDLAASSQGESAAHSSVTDSGVTESGGVESEFAARDEVDREIEDLRQKLARLGHVNLDALDELDELELRFSRLDEQYRDLSSAKASLQKIIERINADSRQMFAETLETVRGHFAALFRKLFGGGQADIVLEEGVDLLEGGVDINARPPGKELRNISLLSGGEKTMTCVALLLAIFRSRPAPFCVLDEVDAALDEANIGRFTSVLEEFTAETQFVVVTHSKKTMTCANTLYGVTMQESGVSKRVSVRFEDVSDDGRISLPPGTSLTDDETQAA